jgi:hypothetical protein
MSRQHSDEYRGPIQPREAPGAAAAPQPAFHSSSAHDPRRGDPAAVEGASLLAGMAKTLHGSGADSRAGLPPGAQRQWPDAERSHAQPALRPQRVQQGAQLRGESSDSDELPRWNTSRRTGVPLALM